MNKPEQNKPEQAAEANELEILFPDREITLAGETVIVRELRFAEQLKHHHLLAPLAAALEAAEPTELAGLDSVNRIYDLLAAHEEQVVALVAICCDRDETWVRNPPTPADGENLLLTWWGVNSGFFIRRVWRPKLVEQARRQATAASSPP